MNYWHLAAVAVGIIGVRTFLWHLRSWQIREYRWDRMRAHFRTHDGKREIFNLWFFRGILPRPRISFRVLLIVSVFAVLSGVEIFFVHKLCSIFWTAIIWERTISLLNAVSVWVSQIPVFFIRRKLFHSAKWIVENSKLVTKIGITGSYGKSSTKEILVHLLKSKFGKENVLWNPENENNEVAIARLIKANKYFFQNESEVPKFFIVEIGAYKRGEIRDVCRFVRPQVGIITGLNAQHAELFGSPTLVREAKFELAEAALDRVFFNADTPALVEIFEDRSVQAVPIGISKSVAKNISAETDKTTFEVYGEKFVLPWGGEFFVGNALLALECARESGCNAKEMMKSLAKIQPLPRALNVAKMKSGATLLNDLYSANPDGVIGAIEHLGKFPGKKIFIGIPLRELGENAHKIHEQIFRSLKKISAEVFWLKKDFAKTGKEICGKKFHCVSETELHSNKLLKNLKTEDAVLLESRLPTGVTKLFS